MKNKLLDLNENIYVVGGNFSGTLHYLEESQNEICRSNALSYSVYPQLHRHTEMTQNSALYSGEVAQQLVKLIKRIRQERRRQV